MPLRVFCPNGHVMMVPDERAGRNIACPKCRCEVIVPLQGKPPAAQEGAAAPTAKMTVPTAALPKPKPPVATPPATNAGNGHAPAKTPPPLKTDLVPAKPPAKPQPAPPPKPKVETPPKPAEIPTAAEIPAAEAAPTPPPLPPPPLPPPVVPPPVVAAEKSAPPSAAASPAPPPLPPAPPPEPAPSVISPPIIAIAPPDHIHGAYYLSALVVGVAIMGAGPAVWEIFDYLQFPTGHAIAGWAFVLLLIAVVQIAYAIYVAHLPDWTSAWVISIVCLSSAVLYAMLLGITFVSREESRLIQALQLTDKLAGNKAAFWSIAMISVLSLLSWFAGHISARWHRAEALMRHST